MAASAGVDVELLRDRLLERATAPVEDAGELAGAAAGDEQRRRLVPDRDDDGRGVVGGRRDGCGLDEGTQQAERLEIDAREPDAGRACNVEIRLDLVARSDDEQDAARRARPSSLARSSSTR